MQKNLLFSIQLVHRPKCMMHSNAHLSCKGVIIACRLSTSHNMVISPLGLLAALSGGSVQLLCVLVDHTQLSQAGLTLHKYRSVAKITKQWLKLALFLQLISVDKGKRLKVDLNGMSGSSG